MAQQDDSTPLMKQYWELKSQADDALLLFRMGDFYELFGEDAVEASRILEITLTSRDKNKANPMPMAGVPHHSIQGYIQRLLKAGKKVAIGEQMEDPGKNKIVRREIVRTFTPGVQFDMEGAEANYLAAIAPTLEPSRWTLACLDASTGETLVSDPLSAESLESELAALPIRQVLTLGPSEVLGPLSTAISHEKVLIEQLPSNYLSREQAVEVLKRQYAIENLAALVNLPVSPPLNNDDLLHALGIAVAYTLKTQQQEKLSHLRIPAPLRRPKTMILGPRTVQHLDLVPQSAIGDSTPNLFQLINKTRSALGARQLKRWLLAPLKNPEEIRQRQEAVRELGSRLNTTRLSETLGEVYDLERILGRVNTKLANPRDTFALGRTLNTLPALASRLKDGKTSLLKEHYSRLAEASQRLSGLGKRIVETQLDTPPITIRDGGIFKTGTTPELDRLLTINDDGQRWLLDLETRERETTGIPSLKVRYNRVFGYYIEITQAHLKNVPSHYQRKQTTVGAERFFTEELKKFEDDIVNASARQKALEQELFNDLLKEIQSQTPVIMEAAKALGEIDALLSLGRLSQEPGWTFPEINDSLDLEIEAGRHPLVDSAGRGAFVPNDLKLSRETFLTLIITGPNMGGKSTVMRQTALIVLLGQMGAPVPASRARWGAVSSLYTRIGAHDAIARGQSTFMVEMSELAHILHHADDRSLIILDEIGRGTSTYDGISVAWATLEWLCTQVRSRTLFATHYHELTRLTSTLPHCANAHMAVEGGQPALRFLYKLRPGPANESFGIHVAQIAGVPPSVIARAWKVLEELESHSPQTGQIGNSQQLPLFVEAPKPEPVPNPVLLELENADLNQMTPIQALNWIVKLQETSRESAQASSAGLSRRPPRDSRSRPSEM